MTYETKQKESEKQPEPLPQSEVEPLSDVDLEGVAGGLKAYCSAISCSG